MKKQNVTPLPQADIDLVFWQYTQGVKDVVTQISATNQEHQLKLINQFIHEKLERIKGNYNRSPSFTLHAEVIMGKIEIKKRLL